MGRSIVLREWERREAGLAPDDPLAGLSFDDSSIERAARAVGDGDRLRVYETRRGLGVEARAFVGTVQVGPLRITVTPKIATEDLWYLVVYGMGLDAVDREFPVEILLPEAPFADVLALLLLQEANALWVQILSGSLKPRDSAGFGELTCAGRSSSGEGVAHTR